MRFLSKAASFLVLLFILAIGATTLSSAQTPLKDFGRKAAAAWRAERAAAESIAAIKHIPIRSKLPDGRITELQGFDDGIPRVYITDNLNAARTTNAYKVWSVGNRGFSLDGTGDTLGEWDGGSPRITHQEFGDRIITSEGTVIEHATHVAGTMIAQGIVNAAHGMSNHANLKSFDWNDDVAEMATAAAAGLQVSNHSYGTITGWTYNYYNDNRWAWFGKISTSSTEDYKFGDYNSDARSWDILVVNAPYYLPVKSSGNDRGEGPSSQPVSHWVFDNGGNSSLSTAVHDIDGGAAGYQTIGTVASAKNILVVGAVNKVPNGYEIPGNVTMSSFSSWGPTDDGRIKPDIVGDGVNLYSTVETGDAAYDYLSGTSMATPNVSGSLGLLLQHQRNLHGSRRLLASTLKGLVLHTAGDAGNPGPDYVFGWGLMNTLAAAQLMSLDSADGDGSHIETPTLVNGGTFTDTIYSDGVKQLDVSICWTDPAGSPSPSTQLNPTALKLVNDLDLRLTDPDDTTIYPWVLDPSNPSANATRGDNFRDNVEHILVSAPKPGRYVVTVTHKNTITGTNQVFSLIKSGNVIYYKPILAVAGVPQPKTLAPGGAIADSMKIYNRGNHDMDVQLSSGASWLKPDTGSVTLQSGDSTYIHWTVDAGLLSMWSSFSDSVSIITNDSAHSPWNLGVNLTTTGPRAGTIAARVVDVDSGAVAHDSIWIVNTGTNPLIAAVLHDDSTATPWLSIPADSVTIAVGDSAVQVLDIDAGSLGNGKYTTSIAIIDNDSATASQHLPLTVYVGKTVTTSLRDRWNLVSVGLRSEDELKADLYPTAQSPAYYYTGVYAAAETLKRGTGYWMKFSGSQVVTGHGFLIDSLTIPVVSGWNLIGSISYPVNTGTIVSNPPGLSASQFFGYEGQYAADTVLEPGKAYWVRVNGAGALFLNAVVPASLPGRIVISPTHDLPPAPPAELDQPVAAPKSYALGKAYPNPFNPSTRMELDVPQRSMVSVAIYDLLGRKVASLADGFIDAGVRTLEWNGANSQGVQQPSGVYFVRVAAEGFSATQKILMMK